MKSHKGVRRRASEHDRMARDYAQLTTAPGGLMRTLQLNENRKERRRQAAEVRKARARRGAASPAISSASEPELGLSFGAAPTPIVSPNR